MVGRLIAPLLAAVTALAVVSHTSAAEACGAFFPSRTDQNLALDAQRALMVVGADTVELHLQLVADSGGARFSWLVPVPKAPRLSLGDSAIFEALDVATRPSVTVHRGGGGGGGGFCGSDAKGPGGDFGDRGVQHFGGGTLGGYIYDIVASQDAAALEAWLTDNGYEVPAGFGPEVQGYLQASVFVAVKLDGQASPVDLQPLVVSYDRPFGSSLGYAFRIARLSTPESAPLLLWVLADKRYRVANYGAVEVSRVARTMRDADLDYEGAVERLTREANGRLTIVEYARDIRGESALVAALGARVAEGTHYLTRIYGDIPKAAMEDLVITFAHEAPDVDPVVEVGWGGGSATGVALALGIVGLVLARRRSSAR